MADEEQNETGSEGEGEKSGMSIAHGIWIGSGIGTVIFAITGEAWWIAMGAAFGIVFGAVFLSFNND
jgi:hypothetical protein